MGEKALIILSDSDSDMKDSETAVGPVARTSESHRGDCGIVVAPKMMHRIEIGDKEKGKEVEMVQFSDTDPDMSASESKAVDRRTVVGHKKMHRIHIGDKGKRKAVVLLSDTDEDDNMSASEREVEVNLSNPQEVCRGPVLAQETTHALQIANRGKEAGTEGHSVALETMHAMRIVDKGKEKAAVDLHQNDMEGGESSLPNLGKSAMFDFVTGCKIVEGVGSSSEPCATVDEAGISEGKAGIPVGKAGTSEKENGMAGSFDRHGDQNFPAPPNESHSMSLQTMPAQGPGVGSQFRRVQITAQLPRVHSRFRRVPITAQRQREISIALIRITRSVFLGAMTSFVDQMLRTFAVEVLYDRIDRQVSIDNWNSSRRAYLNIRPAPECPVHWAVADNIGFPSELIAVHTRPAPKCPLHWVPSRQSNFRKNRVAKSLWDMALQTLCSHFKNVECLAGLPEEVTSLISTRLCIQGPVTPDVFRLYMALEPQHIIVADCRRITEETFLEVFGSWSTSRRIEVLELRYCGLGFTDNVCATIRAAGLESSLQTLHTLILTEAYRLTDVGLITLLNVIPHLTTLKLSGCSSISTLSIQALAMSTSGPTLRALYVDSCGQLDPFQILDPMILNRMSNLESVSLSEHQGISNAVVITLAVHLGHQMRELSISGCIRLDDIAVKVISLLCPSLELLDISHIPLLSNGALASLSCGSSRQLRTLRLDGGNFSDVEVAAFIITSGHCLTELSLNNVPEVGNLTIGALAEYSKETLEQLNMAFCRKVNEIALGFLVDNCSNLHGIRLFGCTQVTNSFLEGHSNSVLTIQGAAPQI